MFSLKPAEGFKPRSDDDKDKKKAVNDKSFIFTFKIEILRHEMYNKGRGANTVMLLLGDKTSKAIGIARKTTGTQLESIGITEPEMKPAPVKSYATVASTLIAPDEAEEMWDVPRPEDERD